MSWCSCGRSIGCRWTWGRCDVHIGLIRGGTRQLTAKVRGGQMRGGGGRGVLLAPGRRARAVRHRWCQFAGQPRSIPWRPREMRASRAPKVTFARRHEESPSRRVGERATLPARENRSTVRHQTALSGKALRPAPAVPVAPAPAAPGLAAPGLEEPALEAPVPLVPAHAAPAPAVPAREPPASAPPVGVLPASPGDEPPPGGAPVPPAPRAPGMAGSPTSRTARSSPRTPRTPARGPR